MSAQPEISTLFRQYRHNPHEFLGLHPVDERTKVIRLFRPGAAMVYLEVFGNIVEAKKVGNEGFFEYQVPAHTTHLDYKIYHQNGLLAHDPYAFLPTFGEMDAYLFGKGVHYRLYEVLGAKIAVHQGVAGTKFAVWAPSAKEVSLIGDFNYWDGSVTPMRNMGASGVWELFLPGLGESEKYKFEIRTQEDRLRVKGDPFAFQQEMRPKTASIISSIDQFTWSDDAWMEARVRRKRRKAIRSTFTKCISVLGKKEGHFLNYREIAHELAALLQRDGIFPCRADADHGASAG